MTRDKLLAYLRHSLHLVDRYVSISDSNRDDIIEAIAWLEDDKNGQEFHIVNVDLHGFGTSLYKGWVLE